MKIVIGKKDALGVVDGQVDFVYPTGGLPVNGIPGEVSMEEAIGNILSVARCPFGYRFTTEDEHCKDHIEYQIYKGEHCGKGTSGQKYIPFLKPFYDECNENIIKGEDEHIIAYSVATSRDFVGHITRLRSRSTERVFLTGWAYTHCVGESAIAYASQGFETYVVRDATRSVPPPFGNPEVMDKKLALYGVKLISTSDIS